MSNWIVVNVWMCRTISNAEQSNNQLVNYNLKCSIDDIAMVN